MYPYFYPSYFTPQKTGNQKQFEPDVMPMPGTAPGKAQMPTIMPGMQPTMPSELEVPPTPGTTAGPPVESVPQVPPYIGAPDVTIGQEPGPPVTTDIGYTQAFLKTQIGKRVKIEFLIGTNSTTDRIGTLVDVGISYILLQLAETDDLLMGDLYAIKFVTIYQ